jgi:hypothetical protein
MLRVHYFEQNPQRKTHISVQGLYRLIDVFDVLIPEQCLLRASVLLD